MKDDPRMPRLLPALFPMRRPKLNQEERDRNPVPYVFMSASRPLAMFRYPTYRKSKRSLIQMFTRIVKPPAALPWITRPEMSISTLVAVPHSTDPMKKTQTAASITAFRPHISLNFPHSGPHAACESRYPDPTHIYATCD